MAETAQKNPRIILRRTSKDTPEYRVMRDLGLNRETVDTVYSARQLDSHYLLERWDGATQLYDTGSSLDTRPVIRSYRPLGIAHTNSEADSRLVAFARDEFAQIRNRIENPSQEQVAENKRVREHFGLTGNPTPFVFIDETA